MSRNSSAQKKAKAKVLPKGKGRLPPKKGGSSLMNNRSEKQRSVASAYSTGQMGSSPAISMGPRGASCRIRHRELVTNVTGSAAFAVSQTLALNPGLSAVFPWLSTIAQAWEKYKFHSLRFKYFTRTGSTTPGSVILAPDYDASDAAPVTEQIASAFNDIVEDTPWKDLVCTLSPNGMNGSTPQHYVRTGPNPSTTDPKLTDVGQLFICTVDGTAVPWGKIWVEYDVEFYVPQLPATGLKPYGGRISSGGGVTPSNPLGTIPVIGPFSIGFQVSNSSVVTFLALGDYVFSLSGNGTGFGSLTFLPGSGLFVIGTNISINAASTSFTSYTTLRVTSTNVATLGVQMGATTVTNTFAVISMSPDISLN